MADQGGADAARRERNRAEIEPHRHRTQRVQQAAVKHPEEQRAGGDCAPAPYQRRGDSQEPASEEEFFADAGSEREADHEQQR